MRSKKQIYKNYKRTKKKGGSGKTRAKGNAIKIPNLVLPNAEKEQWAKYYSEYLLYHPKSPYGPADKIDVEKRYPKTGNHVFRRLEGKAGEKGTIKIDPLYTAGKEKFPGTATFLSDNGSETKGALSKTFRFIRPAKEADAAAEAEPEEADGPEDEEADGPEDEEADASEDEEADGTEAESEEADGTEAESEEADGTEAEAEEADVPEDEAEEADGTEAEYEEADGTEAEYEAEAAEEDKEATAVSGVASAAQAANPWAKLPHANTPRCGPSLEAASTRAK